MLSYIYGILLHAMQLPMYRIFKEHGNDYGAQEELTPNQYLAKLADGFLTLIDMRLFYYKFFVRETGHKITLCFSQSKTFYMNKITYSTFAEYFEDMTVKTFHRYYQFRLSMLYTFKLVVPDQENFELAKTIGFIDSNRIDWCFWKENIIADRLYMILFLLYLILLLWYLQ
ncbi:hypothetical protein BDF21DRAFT_453797 [Thamnidium elegans]|nr:hypothetical protein BDF21DRAFT_453797 [Thamnidium elegans]